jgi:O-antigen chain-terminating methyltransferase
MITFIKKNIKKLINKLFPYFIRKFHEIGETRSEVKDIKCEVGDVRREVGEIKNTLNLLTDDDFQFFKLRKMLVEIEYYQPAYMIGGLNLVPKRECKDRCRAIEKSLNCSAAGLKILDIGSSLGYVCYYFADRSAITEGWESNPDNAEAARLIGRMNGIPAAIKTKELNIEAIKEIQPREYDIIIMLSVLHHIVYSKGLEYTQELIRELFDKAPTLIVELAVKDEDTTLYWNEALPEDELAIFDMIRGEIEISKIGEFQTHLSQKTRPLYKISKIHNTLTVNNKVYFYDKKTSFAYKDSELPYWNPRFGRSYYFSDNYIIKEYMIDRIDDNIRQIAAEIGNMLFLNKISKLKSTKLIDFEIKDNRAIIVFAKDHGKLVSDILSNNEINPEIVAKDILEFLAVLEENNCHHNDIRSWNILWDGEHAQVIDYGLLSPLVEDDDIVSLLWVLDAINVRCKEDSLYGNKPLPPKSHFDIPRLQGLYEIVEEGERSPKKLLDLFDNYYF